MSYLIPNMTQRLHGELTSLDKKKLHSVWRIPQTHLYKHYITINKSSFYNNDTLVWNNTYCAFKVKTMKRNFFFIYELPIDVCCIISNFLTEYINININIKFPWNFPYNPPEWRVFYILHNIHSPPVNLHQYYSDIVHKHNKELDVTWVPAMRIETDLINFFQKINHFEYMF